MKQPSPARPASFVLHWSYEANVANKQWRLKPHQLASYTPRKDTPHLPQSVTTCWVISDRLKQKYVAYLFPCIQIIAVDLKSELCLYFCSQSLHTITLGKEQLNSWSKNKYASSHPQQKTHFWTFSYTAFIYLLYLLNLTQWKKGGLCKGYGAFYIWRWSNMLNLANEFLWSRIRMTTSHLSFLRMC